MVFLSVHTASSPHKMLWFVVYLHHSVAGLQGSDQDREDLQGRLQLAETRAEELAESLKAATSSMEQYRSMAQSLEESLDKEKQVGDTDLVQLQQ